MRKILLSLVFTAWMGLAWAATPKQVVLQAVSYTHLDVYKRQVQDFV